MSSKQMPSEMPPEREAAYLANAELAVREATDPVVSKLGELVIGNAESIIDGEETTLGPVYQAENIARQDANSSALAEEAETFLQSVADDGKTLANEVERYTNEVAQNNVEQTGGQGILHEDKLEPATIRELPATKASYGTDYLDPLSHISPQEQTKLGELDKEE